MRLLLAGKQALFALSMLGLISGVFVGFVIIIFRYSMEIPQMAFLPGGDSENYEALSWEYRLGIACAGGALLGLVFQFISKTPLRVGILHVLERLSYNEGNLPWRNLLAQFFGATVAIISGLSVGREGPSVHLGAGTASLLGQYLRLPNNSIRILVGCGVAAAIAASFNTPLAGVIFAMEVVLMEYTITGFTPVILAAVSSTAVSQLIFDSDPILNTEGIQLHSLAELPIIIVMAVMIGAIAAMFIRLTRIITLYGSRIAIGLRMTLAGVCVGLMAIVCPEIMGVGYDTVDAVILGQIGLLLMILILVMKILATSICVGLSIPAGLIGPSVFIGAIAGGIIGKLVLLFGFDLSEPGLYALLGMVAMMSATLQAPLAALLALLELTGNQNIIFPGMLVIVTANLTANQLFKSESVFMSQFKQIGLDYRNDPIAQHLRRIGIESAMNKAFVISEAKIKRTMASSHLKTNPDWIVIRREKDSNLLMPASDLARHLENDDEEEIDLMDIPAKRRQLAPVNLESTLQHAQSVINETESDALYVIRKLSSSADRIYGILTQEDIEKHYRFVNR